MVALVMILVRSYSAELLDHSATWRISTSYFDIRWWRSRWDGSGDFSQASLISIPYFMRRLQWLDIAWRPDCLSHLRFGNSNRRVWGCATVRVPQRGKAHGSCTGHGRLLLRRIPGCPYHCSCPCPYPSPRLDFGSSHALTAIHHLRLRHSIA